MNHKILNNSDDYVKKSELLKREYNIIESIGMTNSKICGKWNQFANQAKHLIDLR